MSNFLFHDNEYWKNAGLFILRVGIGAIFICHGVGKLFAGPELWNSLGQAIGNFGIHTGYMWWGLAAGLTEAIGGLCLLLGCATRIAAFFMSGVMVVAVMMHHVNGDSWIMLSHPL